MEYEFASRTARQGALEPVFDHARRAPWWRRSAARADEAAWPASEVEVVIALARPCSMRDRCEVRTGGDGARCGPAGLGYLLSRLNADWQAGTWRCSASGRAVRTACWSKTATGSRSYRAAGHGSEGSQAPPRPAADASYLHQSAVPPCLALASCGLRPAPRPGRHARPGRVGARDALSRFPWSATDSRARWRSSPASLVAASDLLLARPSPGRLLRRPPGACWKSCSCSAGVIGPDFFAPFFVLRVLGGGARAPRPGRKD